MSFCAHFALHIRLVSVRATHVHYTDEDGSAKQFAEEMVKSGIVDRVRAEEGNERYEYFSLIYGRVPLFVQFN